MSDLRSNIKLVIVLYIYFLGFYMVTNHFPLREPIALPQFSFETALPMMPWTVWIYNTVYLMPLLAAVRLIREPVFRSVARSLFILVTISCLIFIAYPTVLARPPLPLATSAQPFEWLSIEMLRLVQRLDAPHNCFPSLHVSASYLLGFSVLLVDRRLGWGMLLWSMAISISTLTTKQHYMVDVLGGFVIALGVFLVVHRARFFESGMLVRKAV